jgi:hypothetical protein
MPSSARSATACSHSDSVSGETSWIEIKSEAGFDELMDIGHLVRSTGPRRILRACARWLRAPCLFALLSLLASSARAQSAGRCPSIAGGSPALLAVDPELRLRWIDERLARTAHRARVWTWAWGTGLVVATVGNLIPLAFVPANDRIDWYAGAATTVVGIVPLLIAPLDVVGDSRALRVEMAAWRQGADLCPLLASAEAKLVRDAKNQADGRRWWYHVVNVALNAGVGLFLGLGYDHWLAGGFNAVSGAVIGEAIIFTQPTSSIDDLAAYRAGSLGGPKTTALVFRTAF